MSKCIFPGCTTNAPENGLCVPHGRVYSVEEIRKGIGKKSPPAEPEKPAKKAAVKKKALKRGKKPNPRSKKMTKVIEEVKKLYPLFLKSRPMCEIRSPDCIKRATVVHHRKGRGNNILKQETWVACCPPCNSYVENHHQWAADNGFKVSQHKIQ